MAEGASMYWLGIQTSRSGGFPFSALGPYFWFMFRGKPTLFCLLGLVIGASGTVLFISGCEGDSLRSTTELADAEPQHEEDAGILDREIVDATGPDAAREPAPDANVSDAYLEDAYPA